MGIQNGALGRVQRCAGVGQVVSCHSCAAFRGSRLGSTPCVKVSYKCITARLRLCQHGESRFVIVAVRNYRSNWCGRGRTTVLVPEPSPGFHERNVCANLATHRGMYEFFGSGHLRFWVSANRENSQAARMRPRNCSMVWRKHINAQLVCKPLDPAPTWRPASTRTVQYASSQAPCDGGAYWARAHAQLCATDTPLVAMSQSSRARRADSCM